MTKEMIEAIRALPATYVENGTEIAFHGDIAIAINPRLVPIMLRPGCEWEPLRVDELPTPIPVVVRRLWVASPNAPVRIRCTEDKVRALPGVAQEV